MNFSHSQNSQKTEILADPKITWYFQGSSFTTNTTLSFNTGDTFIAQCKGAGNGDIIWGNVSGYADVYVTKSAPVQSETITFEDNKPGVPATAKVSQGQLVYSTFEGLYAGFEHWGASVYVYDTPIKGLFARVLLQVSIPRVSMTDSGTYFCSFFDASNESYIDGTSVAWTAGLTLSIGTPSYGRTLRTKSMMEYSFALLSAYKILC